jgi:hypothetical protein
MNREAQHRQARADGVTARMVRTYWHWRTMGADVYTAEGEALASVKHDGMGREDCRALLRAAVRHNRALAIGGLLALE